MLTVITFFNLEILLEAQKMSKQSNETADLVRTYLREIGRVPLLTQEQEIAYGKQVQQLMPLLEAKEVLAKKLHREPTTSEWAMHVHSCEAEMNKIIRCGQRAKQKMIEANLRLVVMIAKKYQHRGLELLDLISEGTMGLHRCVEKFDPTRGYKFSTYAYWWVRQAITRAIPEKGRTIRLPSHVIEKLNKIKKVQRRLAQQLGRTATTSELAAELKVTPKQIRECLESSRLPMSLEMPIGKDQDTELGELLKDTNADPEKFVMQSCLVDDLEALLAELPPQQREVLELRFGLADGQPLTLAKVGNRLRLSRERARQLEKLALKQLRGNRKAHSLTSSL